MPLYPLSLYENYIIKYETLNARKGDFSVIGIETVHDFRSVR